MHILALRPTGCSVVGAAVRRQLLHVRCCTALACGAELARVQQHARCAHLKTRGRFLLLDELSQPGSHLVGCSG